MQSPGCSPSPRWGLQQPALGPGVFRAPLPWSQPPTGRATSWGAAREWVRLWPRQSGHRNLPFLAPHSPEALGAAQGPGNGAGVLGAAPQSPQTNLGSQGGSEHQSWVAAGSLLCEQGSNLPPAPPARHGGFPARLQPPRLHAPVALLALSSNKDMKTPGQLHQLPGGCCSPAPPGHWGNSSRCRGVRAKSPATFRSYGCPHTGSPPVPKAPPSPCARRCRSSLLLELKPSLH